MISETAEMLFLTTASETEALLLESNLIKRLKPRYNVSYRDDKSFPNILLREDHAFPQLLKHRGAKTTKGIYFGPFASAGAVNRTLNTLQRAFLLRSCSDSVFESRTRPCLLFQIKRCSAPCVERIDQAGYVELVHEAEQFLSGKSRAVQDHLVKDMNAAAEALDFERAARFRDRVRAMNQIQSHQGVNPATFVDADVFAAFSEGGHTCIQVFFFRAGQNWGNRPYFPRHDREIASGEVLESFIGQFYDERDAPSLILLSEDIPNRALLAEALSLRGERKTEISVPQRGEKREIVEMALTNAREQLGRRMAENSAQRELLEGVAETFGLENPPRRIEIYDNSHIQGAHAVGAFVVAGADGFEKGEYRKFNIKSADLTPGDDYAMMREVLTRRFARLMKEADETRDKWPDLVLIDGGPGQLAVAQRRARRPRCRRCDAGGHLQGPGPRRRARAFLHEGSRALPPRSQIAGALLPATPARRGPPLRHRHPPKKALQGHRRQSAGRDRGRGCCPQACAAHPFRLGQGDFGGQPRRSSGRGWGEPDTGEENLRLFSPGGVVPTFVASSCFDKLSVRGLASPSP